MHWIVFLIRNPKFTCARGVLHDNQLVKVEFVRRFMILTVVCAFALVAGTGMKEEEDVFARAVAVNAAGYIVKLKPGLCFIHFTDPDAVGHEFNWGPPELIETFAKVDAALGAVLNVLREANIAESSVIIISADRGGHDKGHSRGTPEDMEIPWIAWGKGVKEHFEITVHVNTCDTAPTMFWLLDVQPCSSLDGVVVRSAFE